MTGGAKKKQKQSRMPLSIEEINTMYRAMSSVESGDALTKAVKNVSPFKIENNFKPVTGNNLKNAAMPRVKNNNFKPNNYLKNAAMPWNNANFKNNAMPRNFKNAATPRANNNFKTNATPRANNNFKTNATPRTNNTNTFKTNTTTPRTNITNFNFEEKKSWWKFW
jgi:hypothetical protein